MNSERTSNRLFWTLFFVYIANIVGKTSFSATTAALVNDSILTKTEAGIIGGGFWFLYAVGQFGGGFFTKKMSPYLMMLISVLSATVSNLLLPLAGGFVPMFLVWGMNGVLQFGLWPAILELVSTEILPKHRPKAIKRLALCFCVGSAINYILTAGVLAITDWKYIFIICGIVSGVSLLGVVYSWTRLSPTLKTEGMKNVYDANRKEKLTWPIVRDSSLIVFCIMMIIKSVVDTGIKNWMPTIMIETYEATPSFASLLSVVLLVTNLVGITIGSYIYERTKSDELKTLRILYVIMMPMMVLLVGFRNMNILITTVIMSAITLLIYGSGQVLQMNYPGRFQRWGMAAAIGGVINGFASLGSMIATYSGGFIADHFGWDAMIGIWNGLVILFVILNVMSAKKWKQFRKEINRVR